MSAYQVYLIYEGALSFLFTMIFTASDIYQVTRVGLTPLQLVLVGTTLEATILLFEIPTGVVADVYSRRLSVIVGIVLVGIGFITEGTFPSFIPILIAQVIWGLGFTFTSGATQAWITDEIGEAEAGRAFLRANRLASIAALFGIIAGMGIGSLAINLPIQLGGIGMFLLAIFLAWKMVETGFKPDSQAFQNKWEHMKGTIRGGASVVRQRPMLWPILAIGLVLGLYSEGFDRLWTKHILEQFTFPLGDKYQPIVWFGLLRIISLLVASGAAWAAERRVDTSDQRAIGRGVFAFSLLLITGMFGFALAQSLLLAFTAYVVIEMSRIVISPLYTAWVNQRLDPSVRATVLSMSSQVDAVGQIAGGPWVGAIGSFFSVRAALLTSSFILTPVLGLFKWADRLGGVDPKPEASISSNV